MRDITFSIRYPRRLIHKQRRRLTYSHYLNLHSYGWNRIIKVIMFDSIVCLQQIWCFVEPKLHSITYWVALHYIGCIASDQHFIESNCICKRLLISIIYIEYEKYTDEAKVLADKAEVILGTITGADPSVYSSYYRVLCIYYKVILSRYRIHNRIYIIHYYIYILPSVWWSCREYSLLILLHYFSSSPFSSSPTSSG